MREVKDPLETGFEASRAVDEPEKAIGSDKRGVLCVDCCCCCCCCCCCGGCGCCCKEDCDECSGICWLCWLPVGFVVNWLCELELFVGGRDGREGEMYDFWPRASNIHGCLSPSSGDILIFGSHLRHPSKKSKNSLSLHFIAWLKVFVAGRFFLPLLEFATILGAPVESKKIFFLVEKSTMFLGGKPNTSITQANCSNSFSPGKRGYPVYNSAKIHPRLQISISCENEISIN